MLGEFGLLYRSLAVLVPGVACMGEYPVVNTTAMLHGSGTQVYEYTGAEPWARAGHGPTGKVVGTVSAIMRPSSRPTRSIRLQVL